MEENKHLHHHAHHNGHAHHAAHHSHHTHHSHAQAAVFPMQWHPHLPHHKPTHAERIFSHFVKHHRKLALALLLVVLISMGGGSYKFASNQIGQSPKPPKSPLPVVNVEQPELQANKVPEAGQPNQDKKPPTKKLSEHILQVKLKENTEVDLTNGDFTGQTAGELNKALAKYGSGSKSRLFKADKDKLKQEQAELKAQGQDVADLSQYYRIVFDKDVDLTALSQELKALPFVAEAYPEPLPAPAPTANYQSMQGYRNAAPAGVDAAFAASWPGATGDSVRIADLEYSWNTAHEDLSKARQTTTPINNGTPSDPFNNNNHGTGILGILSSDNNGYGVTGVSNNAALSLVNANSYEYGWDVAGAVYTAANQLAAGDVLLIEQQTWGPTPEDYDFVPVEWIPAIYDAIRYASAKGIIVVEPGANGNQNLDNATYYGTSFPSGKADSGAIIVGAGAACQGGYYPARSRLSFSDYGKRLDLQGWGECVTTTGYGDLSSLSVNALYTSTFNGTSSASPIVAGAAAAFSSAYKKLNGAAPTPSIVRTALKSTGTAQSYATGALSGNIGPLPNLATALKQTDLKPPSTPANLTGSLNYLNKVVLRWNSSTDNVGIKNYRIYRNNILIKTVTPTNTYTDSTTVGRTTYQYKIQAVDKADKLSGFSNILTISTR